MVGASVVTALGSGIPGCSCSITFASCMGISSSYEIRRARGQVCCSPESVGDASSGSGFHRTPPLMENCKDFSNVSIQKWSGRTFVSTPGGPKAPGRELDCPLCVPAAIRVPVPFRGSANGERVPRTFGNLLFVEALGPYSCGLIERRRADTLAV